MIDDIVDEIKTVERFINVGMDGETVKYALSAKQGDKNTRIIKIRLFDSDESYYVPLSNANVYANIKKPDGKYCFNECKVKDANIIELKLTNQILAVPGTAICDIQLRDDNNELIASSANFEIEIEPSMCNENAILSTNEATALSEFLAKAADDEKERTEQENVRLAAETERILKENERIVGETTRITNEVSRNQNMNSINTEFQEIKNKLVEDSKTFVKLGEDLKAAIENSNKATQRANEASVQAERIIKECEAILDGSVPLVDKVTGKVSKLYTSDGKVFIEEVE